MTHSTAVNGDWRHAYGNPELPNDDGSDCDKALEEYWAHRASLN
jgi:hypothetical protein